MTLKFILNGEDIVTTCAAETRLLDLLRDNFGLFGTKAGCYAGICSSCSIIFNGDIVKSCLIPAFRVNHSEIISIEGFSQTDEYQDILQGFENAELENCSFCNTAKILTTHALLEKNQRPAKDIILPAFYGIRCRCTEPMELTQGVMAAAEYRRLKLYGRR